MKLPQDQENQEEGNAFSLSMLFTVIAVLLFVCCLFLIVLLWNGGRKAKEAGESSSPETVIVQTTPSVAELDDLLTGEKRRPEDLDFWDKYPGKESLEPEASTTPTPEPEDDPATDGKHTKLVYENGEEEWVLINPYLPKHGFDFTKLVCQSNIMKYYAEGRLVSFAGVDVSKLQDYIDYTKVKKAGIDFVMVRVGARGYSSGQLVLDDYFSENIKRATDAGLKVGVYFFSQAITEEEALEEANLVLESIKDFNVTYPVAYYMDGISGDVSRIDRLSKQEKTKMAKTFLDAIAGEGYIPMLYGDKEYLLKWVDLSKLTAYDIWLSQLQDIPDYPYKFSMWQYSVKGTVDGIAGLVNMNISFIDYTEK